nr:DUF177 domain-containing protein [Ardenticatena sp.]
MIEFNVAGLLNEFIGATREYDIDEMLGVQEEGLVAVEPVQGHVKFTRTHDGILVQGGLDSVFEVQCVRCLEMFHMPLHIDIEEIFHPRVDLRTGALIPVDPDEMDTLISEKNLLDLTEVVRQLFLLAMPHMPVCTTSCRGLCPHCGQNLNQGQCTCHDDEIDPRWAMLRSLLDHDADTGV